MAHFVSLECGETARHFLYVNKEQIISDIKRVAKANGGNAPGFQKVASDTGLRKSDWYPNLWLRWGDALIEAGFQANVLNTAYDTNFLIEKYIGLIRVLGHFPIEGELRIKAKGDKDFPSHTAFSRLGTKQERIRKILKYCEGNLQFEDILKCCESVTNSTQIYNEANILGSDKVGYVYLMQHGKSNVYKIGKTYNPVQREGQIRLEFPEKIEPIHYIKTDDPSGIEKYWHLRFANKRKEGEWFKLTIQDVSAFKRWRRIY